MEIEHKRKQSFLLRMPTSIREQATEIAREDGTSLSHFISLAIAERIAKLERKSVQRATLPAGSLLRGTVQLHKF